MINQFIKIIKSPKLKKNPKYPPKLARINPSQPPNIIYEIKKKCSVETENY